MLRLILLGGLLMLAAAASAKTAPTYYTPERVAAGRANLAAQPWARQVFEAIQKGQANDYFIGREYGSAADCIAQTDDFIWLMQPTTKIGRVLPQASKALCPIHGEKVREKNAWTAWTTDPIHHPYKVRCRLGGEWYPSNDFLNGDLTSGQFPDDGEGCEYQGVHYYFLREYAHMAYGNNTIPCLRSLSQAWLLTGDKRYARKGCILLARLADEYPNFTDRKDRLYFGQYGGRDPHYTWKTGGIITDLIWECFCLEATAYAYDGLYSYMDQDPELIAFLKAKGMPVESGAELRHFIEERLLRVGMEGLLNGHVHGNDGFHQAAAMACALVMDDYSDAHPNSQDLVDYAFHGIGRAAYTIANGTYRDGAGYESPGYNSIKFDFIRVNRLMEEIRRRYPDRYPVEKYPDLFGSAKGRAMFEHFLDLSLLTTFLPSIGDACAIGAPEHHKPGMIAYVTAPYLYAFERFGDPRFARACARLDGTLSAGKLFESYPEAELKAALGKPEAELHYRDRLLDGYGVGVLEVGPPETGQVVTINYSSIPGHRQYDNLNLEAWARGVNLLPDLGYPFTWDYRRWDSGTMSHNTVTVDETDAEYEIGGQANLLASAGGVHLLCARHDPYPSRAAIPPEEAAGKPACGVTRYERSTVMVEVAAGRFYLVDLFAVNGGRQYDQSWHGPLTPAQAPPLDWKAQAEGTLAGPTVAHGTTYTDAWGRKDVGFPCYLSKIRRAPLTAPAVWHWDYGLPEGDQLNLHLVPLGGPAEVIMGTGRSPARPADWGLDYLLVRRPARGAEVSHYLTVLDPYQKTPTVEGVKVLSEQPLTVQIVRSDGVVDELTLATPPGPSRTTAHRPLGLYFRSVSQGKVTREARLGTAGVAGDPGYAHTTVEAVDWESNQIVVRDAPGLQDDLAAGRYLRLYNADRSAMYRVLALAKQDGRLRLTLDATALLGQGPVTEVTGDALVLDCALPLASGRADEAGKLRAGNDYFAGSYLSCGTTTLQLAGAVRGKVNRFYLRQTPPEAELKAALQGRLLRVWQYGVGDSVEAVRTSP